MISREEAYELNELVYEGDDGIVDAIYDSMISKQGEVDLKTYTQSYETIILALKIADKVTKEKSMHKLHTTAFEKVLNEIDIFKEDEEIKEKD